MAGYVRKLRDAIARAGMADRTYLVIVSDHGFAPIERQLQPNALFKKEGLLTVNAAGQVTAWQAYYHAEGGAGFVHLQNPDDQALVARVRTLLDGLKADPANGLAAIWTRESDLRNRDEIRLVQWRRPRCAPGADEKPRRARVRSDHAGAALVLDRQRAGRARPREPGRRAYEPDRADAGCLDWRNAVPAS